MYCCSFSWGVKVVFVFFVFLGVCKFFIDIIIFFDSVFVMEGRVYIESSVKISSLKLDNSVFKIVMMLVVFVGKNV